MMGFCSTWQERSVPPGVSIQLSLASRGVSTARAGLWLRWNSSSWGVHKPYTSLNAKGVTRWVRGGTSAGHCARR